MSALETTATPRDCPRAYCTRIIRPQILRFRQVREIGAQLAACGWAVQTKDRINLSAAFTRGGGEFADHHVGRMSNKVSPGRTDLPKALIAAFRNSYRPRIAVTVDMLATGTDIKPLEVVFFMRSVASKNFFEQMKGRGVRVVSDTEMEQVSPGVKRKTRYLIVDMLKRHLENLVTYVRHRITNAVTERLNSKIQNLKANARGFRSFENYRIRILFFCGKLDLYPQ